MAGNVLVAPGSAPAPAIIIIAGASNEAALAVGEGTRARRICSNKDKHSKKGKRKKGERKVREREKRENSYAHLRHGRWRQRAVHKVAVLSMSPLGERQAGLNQLVVKLLALQRPAAGTPSAALHTEHGQHQQTNRDGEIPQRKWKQMKKEQGRTEQEERKEEASASHRRRGPGAVLAPVHRRKKSGHQWPLKKTAFPEASVYSNPWRPPQTAGAHAHEEGVIFHRGFQREEGERGRWQALPVCLLTWVCVRVQVLGCFYPKRPQCPHPYVPCFLFFLSCIFVLPHMFVSSLFNFSLCFFFFDDDIQDQ
jgi:hypothetical protein